MADFKQGTAEEVKNGTAQYVAGAIVGEKARTYVGRDIKSTVSASGNYTTTTGNPGTSVFHRTVVYTQEDSSGKVIGADRVVYIEKNGTWQPAAISKDGGKTYQFSDANYPTMSGVAGAGLQNELNSKPPKGVRLNVDAQVNESLTKAGVPTIEKKAVVDSIKNNADQNPTPDPQSGETTQSDEPTETLPELTDVKERTDYGGEDFRYPTDLADEYQDYLKIRMVKYVPRGLQAEGNSFVAQSRLGAGEGEGENKRSILATMYLPIPGGISDSNGVDWSKGDMGLLESTLANFGMKAMMGGAPAATGAAEQTAGAAQANSEALKTAVGTGIIKNLTGVNALQRERGAVFNQNTELLFNGVQLRQFSFNYKFSPRDTGEAEMVKKIIRTLKQGMSPKKANNFTFIKSPHTFFLSYHLRNQDHPYLNKFKECALTSLQVNYTPDGNYATYYDGSMVSYSVTMSFQELEPVFDDDYGSDFNNIGY